MKYKVGKLKLEQIEGSTVDDIRFIDNETNKEYSFDEYLKLINDEICENITK